MKNDRPQSESMVLLSCIPFLKPGERISLLRSVGDHRDLLRLTHSDMEIIVGRMITRARWRPHLAMPCVERASAWLAKAENDLLWIDDHDYPELLREIYDPPAVIFARGCLRQEWKSGFAVVGTRNPTPNGYDAALKVGFEAGLLSRPVVSGLARGIDSAVHTGVVQSGGTAIAVLGNGIDSIYPHRNAALAAAILDTGGALVSEYPPGVGVQRYHFPARNRIITGLVPTLCVVQAPKRSGALISVDYALEQGRDVWVHVSGTSESERCVGTRALVSQGAPMFETFDEIAVGTAGAHGNMATSGHFADPRMALFGGVSSDSQDPRGTMVATLREQIGTAEEER